MKPRPALTAAMAAVALGAVALLAAPGASAAPAGSGARGTSFAPAPPPATASSSPPSATSSPSPTPPPSSTPPQGGTAPGTTSPPPQDGGTATPDPGDSATPSDTGTADPPGDPGPGGRPMGDPSVSWDPGDCTDLSVDEGLGVSLDGLPQSIAAGSGWHRFTFSVRNRTGHTLDDLYVQAVTEYQDGVNEDDSLQLDLAEIQYWDPAENRWTGAFQDSFQDQDARRPFSGTFVASIPRVAAGATAALALRIRIAATAPPGASFALTSAVYAGSDGSCRANGNRYGFSVREPGSEPPAGHGGGSGGESADAPPANSAQVYPPAASASVPAGRDTGSLAATGTSAALPAIGATGGAAVVLGGATVLGARRRRG